MNAWICLHHDEFNISLLLMMKYYAQTTKYFDRRWIFWDVEIIHSRTADRIHVVGFQYNPIVRQVVKIRSVHLRIVVTNVIISFTKVKFVDNLYDIYIVILRHVDKISLIPFCLPISSTAMKKMFGFWLACPCVLHAANSHRTIHSGPFLTTVCIRVLNYKLRYRCSVKIIKW